MPSTQSGREVPAVMALYTVESLLSVRGGQFWIYRVVLLGCIAALASLPLVEIDVAVNAPGLVRPASERVEVRLPYGGVIARVLAHDNEPVTAGQPLLELATPDLDERIARNTDLRLEKQAVLGLLDTLSTMPLAETSVFPGVAVGRIVEIPATVRALRQDFNQLMVQCEANRAAEAKAGTELARAEALAGKGIATQRELDDARYALDRVRAEGRLLIEQARTRWQMRGEEEAAALANLASEAKRLESERALAVVRSPVKGSVQGLVGLSAGAQLAAGTVVGVISPDDKLIVEAVVSTRDIGLVSRNQPVRLQVDAFPYTQWGLLEGRVLAIAADASTAGSGAPPVFKVTIEPCSSCLTRPDGATGTLGKGMGVSARFLTARRTLLQILYQDASEWLDPQSHRPPIRT